MITSVFTALQLVHLLRRFPIQTLNVAQRWLLFRAIMIYPFLALIGPFAPTWLLRYAVHRGYTLPAFLLGHTSLDGTTLAAPIWLTFAGLMAGVLAWVLLLRLSAARGWRRHDAWRAAYADLAARLVTEHIEAEKRPRLTRQLALPAPERN
jgi:hypothetical protein